MKRSLKTTAIAALFSVMGLTGITLLAHTNIANAESPAVAELTEDYDKDDDDDDETEEAISPEALNGAISPEEAVNIALTAATGDVEEVELESENGLLIYEVELSSAEVMIDAQTGEVLEVEAEDDDDEDDEDDD
ncbi:MAG: PepSY domain-containing protein [Leptolyngbyaceae cyanobacterium]